MPQFAVIVLLVAALLIAVPAAYGAEGDGTVLKFCNKRTGEVRYSNMPPVNPDFAPCGSVNNSVRCDPVGNRFIGPGSDAPYAYLDCSKGTRIQVIRHGTDEKAFSGGEVADLVNSAHLQKLQSEAEAQRQTNQAEAEKAAATRQAGAGGCPANQPSSPPVSAVPDEFQKMQDLLSSFGINLPKH